MCQGREGFGNLFLPGVSYELQSCMECLLFKTMMKCYFSSYLNYIVLHVKLTQITLFSLIEITAVEVNVARIGLLFLQCAMGHFLCNQ